MLKEKILNNDDESQEMFQSLILSFHQGKKTFKKFMVIHHCLNQKKSFKMLRVCMFISVWKRRNQFVNLTHISKYIF